MKSPIDSNYRAIEVDSIQSSVIIDKYNQDLKIDVSNFFKGVEEVKIFKCLKTSYRFYYPFQIIGDSTFYEDISKLNISYYNSRWEHKLALDFAEKESRWLEIGSGNSFFLKRLVEKGVFPVGLELNKIEVDAAKKDKLNVLNQDFFSYSNFSEKFDVIAMFQVLEHLSNVSEFFLKARKLLKIKGKIIFSVPNSNPYSEVTT